MEVSGQFLSPTALSPGKEPGYPLNRRLGGVTRVGLHGFEEDKYLLPIPELETRTFQPVA